MYANEVIEKIQNGALSKYENIYLDIEEQKNRYLQAINEFQKEFGKNRDIHMFSVPGRSEICGNHTDHNLGCVFAGAIDRDIIAIVAKNDDGIVRIHSQGFPIDEVDYSKTENKELYPHFTSKALIAGTIQEFKNRGYLLGGFDAYTTTQVLKGSGISSSAAFEVQCGNIMSHLYNNGSISNQELAMIAQVAENEYFGKPCGLMDQMACAVGGFLAIDFKGQKKPIVTPIDFSLTKQNYKLCIVNTGGNHADLNEDYASVPKEMKAVAKYFGKSVLREVLKEDVLKAIPELRKKLGDRAIMRALHFYNENERVKALQGALMVEDFDAFLNTIKESGRSSFEYLQNVYTNKNIEEQGLSLALLTTELYLEGVKAAWRVHGGGFAGTIQVFLPNEVVEGYQKRMNQIFGEGSVLTLSVRPLGACEIVL